MKILFLVVCLAAASQAFDAWSQFKTEFKKEYSSLTEELKRIKIFFENHKKIATHNARQALGLEKFTVGMNEFGDLEQSEFNRLLKGLGNKSRKPTNVFNGVNITVADSIDWRTQGAVTPIKNQGSCGSCWAFSTTGSVEGQLFKKTGNLVSLSEQNLVDCSGSYGNAGCNGGLMDQAFQYIQANGGIDTEDSYPYTGKDGSCSFQASSVGGTVTGFVDVSSGDESALKAAVGTVGPISVAIDASHWSFQFYKSGIYHSIFCSSTSLDHGVLAVGYGTESGTDYWIVKNSWGTTWGEQGFFRLSRNKSNHCGIATQASYPTV